MQVDFGAFFYPLGEGACREDGEVFAAVGVGVLVVLCFGGRGCGGEGGIGGWMNDLRSWGIGIEIYALEFEDIAIGFFAMLERVIAWYVEFFVMGSDVTSVAEEEAGLDGGDDGEEEEGEVLHLCCFDGVIVF